MIEQAQIPAAAGLVEPSALIAAQARVRSLLEAAVSGTVAAEADASNAIPTTAGSNSPVAELAVRFGLSQFELDLALLCVAMELDPAVPGLCAAVHQDERRSYPTFQLALNVLPDAHWSALLPTGPLRRWKLIEVVPAETLTSSRLKIEESVLHFLKGAPALDARLAGLLDCIEAPAALPASYRENAEKLLAIWSNDEACDVVVQLDGTAGTSKRALAAAACQAAGLRLYVLRMGHVAGDGTAFEHVAQLWDREAALGNRALLLELDGSAPLECKLASALLERLGGVVLVSGDGALDLFRRRAVRVVINRPGKDEQQAIWRHALGEYSSTLNGELDYLVSQFTLDPDSILTTGQQVVDSVRRHGGDLFSLLWESCRADSRSSLESRAQRTAVCASWDNIVLPDHSMSLLRALAAQVRRHRTVYEQWGFAANCTRGLGTTALFSGPSGTGKTLAAEVLANELRLDLYRIDLSQVISKYVGETEKNLRGIFDAAENSGAILLFDEADALFGKRSEVKDSHDRYANIEVSYLLQRMEAYRGLAILTTNLRNALDAAFLRRIRFIVPFPFPDPPLRRKIWEGIFPKQTPTANLDHQKLAKLNLPGGNIRNIALNAAFLAADAGQPVRMEHLLIAAKRECSKLEKPLSEAETGGWV